MPDNGTTDFAVRRRPTHEILPDGDAKANCNSFTVHPLYMVFVEHHRCGPDCGLRQSLECERTGYRFWRWGNVPHDLQLRCSRWIQPSHDCRDFHQYDCKFSDFCDQRHLRTPVAYQNCGCKHRVEFDAGGDVATDWSRCRYGEHYSYRHEERR